MRALQRGDEAVRISVERAARPAWVIGIVLLAAGLRPPAALAQKGPITIQVPAAGDYLVWAIGVTETGQVAIPPAPATGPSVSYDLGTPPVGLKQYAIHVLDQRTGLVARKPLTAKDDVSKPIQVSAAEFNRIHRLKVAVTGTGGQPLANATVALQDSTGKTSVAILDPTAGGSVSFENVPWPARSQ
jgi:hypothetical protein